MTSKEWANDQLRYAIAVLKGDAVVSRWPGRFQIALIIKERLEEYGFWWQAEILECWIHRLQPRRADPKGQGGAS